MAKTKVITFLGAPGAGKGTQAKMLADKFGYRHVSTGDVLREAVRQGTPLGAKVKAVMEAGELVSDDLVSEIVRERVTAPDAARVFILDGYPRNVAQASYLDSLASQIDLYVINIRLEEACISSEFFPVMIEPLFNCIAAPQYIPSLPLAFASASTAAFLAASTTALSVILTPNSSIKRKTLSTVSFFPVPSMYSSLYLK